MKKEGLIEREERLYSYKGKDRVVSFEEAKKILDQEPEGYVLHSNFSKLDKMLEGFQEGELILLSGRPKGGKTLFLQTLTSHLSELTEEKILWFSYEVPLKQFLSIFPVLPDGYTPLTLELADIGWLEEKIHEAKVKHNIRAVCIDHLHYLVDMSRMRNSALEIGAIYRKLKLLAIKYRLVIFLISHLRKVEDGKEPTGEDVRDSNLALGEPDTVLIIWRVAERGKEIGNDALLKVVCTRRTGVMEKIIKLEKVEGWLQEKE